MNTLALPAVLAALSFVLPLAAQQPAAGDALPTCWLRLRDGTDRRGHLVDPALHVLVMGTSRTVDAKDLLSLHLAGDASPQENERITRGLEELASKDGKVVDAAVATLTDIGLPVVTPLLRSFADTDAHEPDPRYRLFERILPGHADTRDRSLDLVRLANGDVLRGAWSDAAVSVRDDAGAIASVPVASIRWIALRRARIERTFDLQALHHCTYVGWLDSGIVATATSQLRADCRGYVRLSFDEDGWSTDPDGIADPLPGKRRLQEGFRWGAVLARTGLGERWLVGKHMERGDLGSGRLHFVINDNEHFQNNIGAFRVQIAVTDAFDLGEAH